MKQILVVAAHPDDELLGCAGTIARHVAAGDHVHSVILAEGATSRSADRSRASHEGELQGLAAAARKAAAILGVTSLHFLDFPDNRMDGVDLLDVVKRVEELIASIDPRIIYTHHIGDVNIDHMMTQRAVLTACRPLPGSNVETILAFETVSSTEWMPPASGSAFAPNWFVDITDMLDKKLEALGTYESEMRDWPHPRSLKAVEHLARWRGASAGVEAAEAFVLLRQVVKH